MHPDGALAPDEPSGTIYTCPMHQQIRRQGPGSCPICGMALEPLALSADVQANPELADMSRRFWIGLVLTLPIFVLEMAAHIPVLHVNAVISAQASVWTQLVLSTPVVLWAGLPFFQRGWASLVSRNLNMFTLIALGTGTAYVYSLVATLAPTIFPVGFRGMDGMVDVYYEAAAVITVLVLLGQVLELRAREQTSGAIRALLNLAPKTARRLLENGDDEEISIDNVQSGDRLRVRPGDGVPVDGRVLEGTSAVDESMVSGESMPVAKAPGDAVVAGTINGTGSLVMRAEKVGAQTMLARIVAMVAEAQRSRAPVQKLADTVSGYFVPVVVLIAVAAFVAWAVWGPSPSLAYGLVAAVSVVIIACPCALGLATPMSISVGIGKGGGAGVLIKSAEALERLEKVDTLVLDKTGTLTEGKPRVVAVRVVGNVDEDDVVRLAAALERQSEHPLAAAIMAAARDRGGTILAATDFTSITGKGIVGRVAAQEVALGNDALMIDRGIDVGQLADDANAYRRDGATALFLAIDTNLVAIIAIADPVKAGTRPALNALRADGVRIVMVTGDNQLTADAVGRRIGIDEIRAGVLPDEKYRTIELLKAGGSIVAMAGDGINDAPALAAADGGIAMGAGTDVAIQSAGITLIKGDLVGIVRARQLSRATMRNIKQNLAFAFVYNALGIPIAAGVLYPIFGMLLSPMIAALAMSFSSVSVIANALRLRSLRLAAPASTTASCACHET